MQKAVTRGNFITFEGGEGSGKSSQIKLLSDYFNKLDQKNIVTREPGGTPGAEAVRHLLLSGAAETLGSEMEAVLFSAARSDNVENIIKPALNSGVHVLCDRFFDSTRVYQGADGRANLELLQALRTVVCEDAIPDLTIIIDLDPVEGMKRAAKRRGNGDIPDRFEKADIKIQDLRRKAYLQIAKEEPNRCAVVDGSGSEEAVFDRVKSVVHAKLVIPQTKASPKTARRRTRAK